jgi:hypothetical protein
MISLPSQKAIWANLLATELRTRRQAESGAVVLRILYDGTPEEPPAWGESFIYLAEKAPSEQAWLQSPIVRQYRQQQPEAGGPGSHRG